MHTGIQYQHPVWTPGWAGKFPGMVVKDFSFRGQFSLPGVVPAGEDLFERRFRKSTTARQCWGKYSRAKLPSWGWVGSFSTSGRRL